MSMGISPIGNNMSFDPSAMFKKLDTDGNGGVTKEEFLAKVPVSEYADYVDYVARDMEGEGNQLSSLPTDHYLMSTGRGGFAGKYYIETRVGAVARQTSIDLYQMGIVHNEPFKGMRLMNVTSRDCREMVVIAREFVHLAVRTAMAKPAGERELREPLDGRRHVLEALAEGRERDGEIGVDVGEVLLEVVDAPAIVAERGDIELLRQGDEFPSDE